MRCTTIPNDTKMTVFMKMKIPIMKGMSEMVFGAMMMGMAGVITQVMTDGNIMDTIIYAISSVIKGCPNVLAAALMVPVQTLINFFIGSGSGQAAATMPIMGPLGDIVGISQQSVVLAFQAGDGFTNLFWPTGGTMMAGIAMAGVKYDKWVKYIWKLIAIWTVMAMIMCAISVLINYGPF